MQLAPFPNSPVKQLPPSPGQLERQSFTDFGTFAGVRLAKDAFAKRLSSAHCRSRSPSRQPSSSHQQLHQHRKGSQHSISRVGASSRTCSLTSLLIFAGASTWLLLVTLLLAPTIWISLPMRWLRFEFGGVHWILPSASPRCRWAERCDQPGVHLCNHASKYFTACTRPEEVWLNVAGPLHAS